MKQRQISLIMVIIAILGVLLSAYIIVMESNIIYKSGTFTDKIVLEPDRTDAGYIVLKRNDLTPSALDWARFVENGQNYVFFSVFEGEFLEKVVEFNLPKDIEKGEYYVNYEVIYISGIMDKGTISFKH